MHLSSGVFYDLIFDTGSIISIISVAKLKSLDPDVILKPAEVSISSITGHRISILECWNFLIKDHKHSHLNGQSLVNDCAHLVRTDSNCFISGVLI